MPLFCLMYLIAYIDRQNVSYAKLDMVQALGLSEAAYGLGASLFFIGYFLFEAPSNLILARVGARVWFARIMFTWGLVTLALGFTQNATMFYVLRFLLGVTEAGFFPGVLYVLTLWYPQAHRARMVGLFMIASAVANAVGAAVGGLLLDLDGTLGWPAGSGCSWSPAFRPCCWRPTSCGACPTARPGQMAAAGREGLAGQGPDAERGGAVDDHRGAWKAIFDPRVLLLAGLYIGMPLGAYGLSYWLPTIVKSFGVSNTVNGLINVIPWIWSPWRCGSCRATPRATAPAPGTSPDRPGGRDRPDPERGPARRGAEVRHAVHRRPGHLRGPAGVLEPAAQLPQRTARGGRHRGDQRDRQSGRLHRPEPGAAGARRDGQRPGAHAGPGRRAGGDQRADLLRHGYETLGVSLALATSSRPPARLLARLALVVSSTPLPMSRTTSVTPSLASRKYRVPR
jgi:MFS family permease